MRRKNVITVKSSLLAMAGVVSVFFLFAFAIAGCGKSTADTIPYVIVNYKVTVQEFNIKNKNGTLVVPGYGVAGLILTKVSGTYQAFDRCSTVNPQKACAVVIDESALTATDTCSGGIFSLYDGTPVKAPAKINLKEYTVTVGSNSLIQVTN